MFVHLRSLLYRIQLTFGLTPLHSVPVGSFLFARQHARATSSTLFSVVGLVPWTLDADPSFQQSLNGSTALIRFS